MEKLRKLPAPKVSWKGFPAGSAVKNNLVMQETWVGSISGWVRSLDWEDPLEKEMAIHSSILAWEIPWTEESGEGWKIYGVAKSQTWPSD